MNFKQFVGDEKVIEEKGAEQKYTVKEWIDLLTDGKGLDIEKVYIIVGSFINKLKQ
jgi:hypothetical protein